MFFSFLTETVLISLSGVMTPGPVTTVAVSKGAKSPYAGTLIALGHAAVEFPLMVALYYGFGRFLTLLPVKASIALVGGLFLLYMGQDMLRQQAKPLAGQGEEDASHSPFVAGILLSAGNPYFLIWWATVGTALLLKAAAFGLVGFLSFALAHWFCDLAWLSILSGFSFGGQRAFGPRLQRGIVLVCGLFLLFFGAKFLVDAVHTFVVL